MKIQGKKCARSLANHARGNHREIRCETIVSLSQLVLIHLTTLWLQLPDGPCPLVTFPHRALKMSLRSTGHQEASTQDMERDDHLTLVNATSILQVLVPMIR